MIGIKLEDKNKILDYCIGECTKECDNLYDMHPNIIITKSEQVKLKI